MLGVREEGEIDRGSPRWRFYRGYQLTTQSRRKHFSLPWWNIENRLLHSKSLATNKLNSSPFTVLVGALEIIYMKYGLVASYPGLLTPAFFACS